MLTPIHRTLFAALAFGAAAVLGSAPARADIVILRTGEVIPKTVKLEWGEVPSDEQVEETAPTVVEQFAYDAVKVAGREVPAGQVAAVFFSKALKDENFHSAVVSADSSLWDVAAAAYEEAAGTLQGPSKQEALWRRLLCLANLTNEGAADTTLAAADAFVTEFPKGYYLGPLHVMRARVFAQKGKLDGADEALKAVAGAAGMNPRDAFEAQYTSIWLTKMLQARTAEDFAASEKAFRALVTAIDGHPRGKQDAPDQRIKALARVAKALALQGKGAEARQISEQAIASADRHTDKGTLAAVYAGLGDALFLLAKQAKEAKKVDDAKDLAERAALAYLRVTDFYSNDADLSDTFNATQNAARVFGNLFSLSGDKDCVAASRAYEKYRQAVQMLGQGQDRRDLLREGTDLKARMDKACGAPPPPAGGGGN